MEFVETTGFKRAADALLTDEEQRDLHTLLVENPEAGPLARGGGGIRKLRVAQSSRSKGKSGGIRVIYYHQVSGQTIFLLVAYAKGRQDELTDEQLRTLRNLVKEEFR